MDTLCRRSEVPVLLDYTLCDGVQDCPAVRICDAGALYFDSSTGKVEYRKELCRNCGTCANYCGMNAVMYAPADEEWKELRSLVDGQ